MNQPILLSNKRKDWEGLVGQTRRFRGTVDRFGHKHRQGADIKKGATLCLVNVHLKYSNKVIDHVWVSYTAKLAKFGEYLKPGSVIEFDAVVVFYGKGGKNGTSLNRTGVDIGLDDLSEITIVSHPRLKKDDLVGDELISLAIRTRTNVKRGIAIGEDPKGYLGTIYIGQGFANRLARILSGKWHSEYEAKTKG